MVDAEHSPFQPAIDALTLRLQQRHNRGAPLVFNTYQARPPRPAPRQAVPVGLPEPCGAWQPATRHVEVSAIE